MMKFALLFVLVAFVVAVVNADEEEFKCEQNVPYIENECNSCFCTPNGKLACTLKGCLSQSSKDLHNCQVGTTSQKDCNKCWCVKNIGTVCTNNKC